MYFVPGYVRVRFLSALEGTCPALSLSFLLLILLIFHL